MDCEIKHVYCGANRIISSLGADTKANYRAIEAYKTNINEKQYSTPLCRIDRGELDFEALDGYSFAEQISIMALSDVIVQTGVSLKSPRTLLIISTTKGNIECLNDDFKRSYLWTMAGNISGYFECLNTPQIVSNACISGTSAIIIGSRLIEDGTYDNVYVLGVDVISEFIVSGFNSFKSISPTVCRPYDASRDGLTLGEACGVLFLTNDRNLSDSKVIIAGGGISDDSNHISGPSRTGEGLFNAIDASMKQAGVVSEEIGFVNAHGTATSFNDEMESKALDMASLTAVPCNSLKPYLGHTLGASGVIETILAVEQLCHNHIFGVKGYSSNGVPFELNVTSDHRDMQTDHCLKTVSGFGGTNAAIVLSKEAVCKQRRLVTKVVNIVDVAHIEIVRQENTEFAAYIREEYRKLGESNMKFFKMDNLSKLGYVASCKLLKGIELNCPSNRMAIVMANRSSSMDTDINHQAITDRHLPEGASPSVFVYTLANIVAAEIAIKHKFKGELSFFVMKEKSLNGFIAEYSEKLIRRDICDVVMYGWCELSGDEYNAELKLIKGE